jgi:hypothetical protein
MAELNTEPAELRFTIEVKRAETGLVDVYELVGHIESELETKEE